MNYKNGVLPPHTLCEDKVFTKQTRLIVDNISVTNKIYTMKLKINRYEANVIQVALDHLFELQEDVLADAILTNNRTQIFTSQQIIKSIGDIHAEIQNHI